MRRCKMGFAKHHQDYSPRMLLTNFSDLMRGMAVARANLPQILARHAIQSIDAFRVFPRGHQQFIKRLPVITPIKIETYPFAKLSLINLATPPFMENMLIAG